MSPRVLHYSDLETAYDTPARIGRVAACVDALDGPDALIAGSGDDTGPGVLSLVTQGRQALDFFGAVDPAVETVGNHDLDYGTEALREVVAESPAEWVLANVDRGGGQFGADAGIRPWTVVRVDGATVGVVGVVDDATPEMTPGLDGLTFEDPVEAASEAVAEVTENDPDAVIVLAHTRTDSAEALAKFGSVDAVLAGHEHDPMIESVDGTPISRPGATGRFVHEVDLETGAVRRHETREHDPDAAVTEAVRSRIDARGLDEVVATAEEPLYRDRETRTGGEWRLGNFVADAYRWAAGSDAAIQNTGGIREGPPLAGEVTRGDLIGLSPFDEPVVVVEVSATDLEALAREADGRRSDRLPDYWAGHVSGLSISRDGSGYEVRVDGTSPDPATAYTVAVPQYLLKTDREFPTLSPEMRVRTLDRQYEVIVEYARETGLDADLEGRLPEFDDRTDRTAGGKH